MKESKAMRRVLSSLVFWLVLTMPGFAWAACVGTGGIPFNCDTGTAIGDANLFLGGQGTKTVKFTALQLKTYIGLGSGGTAGTFTSLSVSGASTLSGGATITGGLLLDTLTLSGVQNLGPWATSGRPSSPATGAFGYNTTIGAPEWWTGTAWTTLSDTSSFSGGTVAGATTFSSAVTFSSTIAVTGLTALGGNATIVGTLGIGGTGTNSLTITPGVASTNAISLTQNGTGGLSIGPAAVFGSTVGITGAATLTSNATIGGTLGVTGASTLTGNTSVGGTLGVTGATIVAALTAVSETVTGNATVGGTFGVTGLATLASETVTGPLALKGPNGTTGNPGLQIYPTLHADGVTSDDVAFKAAIDKCSATGGTVYLPSGRILMTGAAGTINLHNCAIVGVGVQTTGITGQFGTEINLTSTSVIPFTIAGGWSITGVNFYWPNQTTGLVVYPPLFQDGGTGTFAYDWSINNVDIINAYDGFSNSVGASWGRFFINGGVYYAVHDLFRLANIGDGAHITMLQMTPGPWLNRCGGVGACGAAVDAGANNNTMLHVINGGGEIALAWDNSGTFDWRYGIRLDAGALVGQSGFQIGYDGTGTILDASSGGTYAYQNSMTVGVADCGATYSYVSNSNTSYHPCFNLGANSSLALTNSIIQSEQDAVDISGGGFSASGSFLSIGPSTRGGGNTYAIHATGAAVITLNNVVVAGAPADAGMHGIVSTAAGPTSLTLNAVTFEYLNDAVNSKTSPLYNLITNSFSFGISGANSVIFTDSTYPVIFANNQFDKPTSPPLQGQTLSPMISGNLTMTAPTGYIDFANGATVPPTAGTTSAGTRLRFFNNAGPPDYSMGIETANVWFADPSYGAPNVYSNGGGWKFYGGTTNIATLDVSGGWFSQGLHTSRTLETGSAQISTSGTTTTFDVPGRVIATVAVNAGGIGFTNTDILTDSYGSLYTITTIAGGVISTIAIVQAGGVSGAAPCTTACALHGGTGSGATVNLTWTAGTTINIGPTAATAINLGNSGSITNMNGMFSITPGQAIRWNPTGPITEKWNAALFSAVGGVEMGGNMQVDGALTVSGTMTVSNLIAGTVTSAPPATVAAAGTNQATATRLTASINIVTPTAPGTGVQLPAGGVTQIANRGANQLLVYPPSGAQIETAGTNNPATVARFTNTSIVCVSTQCTVLQ